MEEKYSELNSAIYNNFPNNLIFPKGFLLNRVKKMFFDLKLWGPLKIFKSRSGSYSGLTPSIYVKKQNLNLAGLSL